MERVKKKPVHRQTRRRLMLDLEQERRQTHKRLLLDLERERLLRFQVLLQLKNLFVFRAREVRLDIIHAERKRLRLLRRQVVTEIQNYVEARALKETAPRLPLSYFYQHA